MTTVLPFAPRKPVIAVSEDDRPREAFPASLTVFLTVASWLAIIGGVTVAGWAIDEIKRWLG